MANKTYDQLRSALASMWGFENYSDLGTQDQADIDSIIGGAYFDCYVPVDGSRPNWPVKHQSGILKASVSATLTLTNGLATVTGYVFEATYFGSFVKIGERFYRYNAAGTLSAPWDGETGDYPATVYHNAYNLSVAVVEMAGIPNLLGVGLLGPMPNADAELMLRTEPAFDFARHDGRMPFATSRNHFRQSAYFDTGDPRYYHIDQSSVASTFAQASRFHVYPLPDRVFTFEFNANITPAALSSGTDIPVMPFGTVDNILLPIAREKLAMNTIGRRYTGNNVRELISQANDARAQLKGLRRIQRDTGSSMRPKRGW